MEEPDFEALIHMILLASENHDVETLHTLFKTASANVQDPETLVTPLHAAIATAQGKEEIAAKTLKVLLQNGAVWNDLDANDETPACLAYRLGLTDLYEIMIDAGVRAELLLSRLDQYQLLGDEDEVEDEVGEDIDVEDPSANNEAYLRSTIPSHPTNLLDSGDNAIMMTWETPIMEAHAKALLPREGMRVLNIGHGLGIFDDIVQDHRPAQHHIIEAHPDVIKRMATTGWTEKPNVTIHHGRWQDIVPNLSEKFDAIYFDTFAESYADFKSFVGQVGGLLADGGKFGMFWGAGADRRCSYDVYTKVSCILGAKLLLIICRFSKWTYSNRDSMSTGNLFPSLISKKSGRE